MNYSLLVLITGLSIVVYQDLRYRKIHILSAILILIGAILFRGLEQLFVFPGIWLIYGFLCLNFLVVLIYFSVKKGFLVNPLKEHIGLGDLFFLIAIAPIFYLTSYIIFFVVGMLFSLILFSILKPVMRQKTIPLAGYLSILLLGFITLNEFTDGCDIFLQFKLGQCI